MRRISVTRCDIFHYLFTKSHYSISSRHTSYYLYSIMLNVMSLPGRKVTLALCLFATLHNRIPCDHNKELSAWKANNFALKITQAALFITKMEFCFYLEKCWSGQNQTCWTSCYGPEPVCIFTRYHARGVLPVSLICVYVVARKMFLALMWRTVKKNMAKSMKRLYIYNVHAICICVLHTWNNGILILSGDLIF